ncbi:PH domain-containing protein [Streptomyces sp. NPDC031705]|uniref:PH domain-containing protein n=1 Tax=Streptomyces sp. NPDC031705 TaxID=3155729 RepID=UPI0033CE23B2
MTGAEAPSPALSIGTPRDRIRPPRHRVEKRAVWWWTIRVVISTAVVLGTLGLTYWLWDASRPWLGPGLVILAAGHAVTAVLMPSLRYRVHRWECTEHAVYDLKGWLVREWRIVPVSRIQSVDVVRGPVQQWLGLATLRVVTASHEGHVKIVGLDADVVARTAAELTALTQATPGDAT